MMIMMMTDKIFVITMTMMMMLVLMRTGMMKVDGEYNWDDVNNDMMVVTIRMTTVMMTMIM